MPPSHEAPDLIVRVAIFTTSALLGGCAACLSLLWRFAAGRVRRSARWLAWLTFGNGSLLALAGSLATARVATAEPESIIMAGIVTGSLVGVLGPDWVAIWLASCVEVLAEAREKVRRRQHSADASETGTTDANASNDASNNGKP